MKRMLERFERNNAPVSASTMRKRRWLLVGIVAALSPWWVPAIFHFQPTDMFKAQPMTAQDRMDYMSWHCPELRSKAIGDLSSNQLGELQTCGQYGY